MYFLSISTDNHSVLYNQKDKLQTNIKVKIVYNLYKDPIILKIAHNFHDCNSCSLSKIGVRIHYFGLGAELLEN